MLIQSVDLVLSGQAASWVYPNAFAFLQISIPLQPVTYHEPPNIQTDPALPDSVHTHFQTDYSLPSNEERFRIMLRSKLKHDVLQQSRAVPIRLPYSMENYMKRVKREPQPWTKSQISSEIDNEYMERIAIYFIRNDSQSKIKADDDATVVSKPLLHGLKSSLIGSKWKPFRRTVTT